MTPAMNADRFEALVRTVGPRLAGFVARRVPVPADAADVLGDTLLVAWRRREVMPADPQDALPWLVGVARGVLANQRRGRTRDAALVARVELLMGDVHAPPPGPDALAVRAALDRLPRDDRDLLTLTAWEGFTPAEAAGILGISPEAARKRLQRARRRMRVALRDQGVEVDPDPAPVAA